MKKENRTNLVGVRLSGDELCYLDRLCKESNLSRSDVMRMSIRGVTIYRVDEFTQFTVQLLKIGNNINQIARVLNYNTSSGVVDNLTKIRSDFNELKKCVSKVANEICL